MSLVTDKHLLGDESYYCLWELALISKIKTKLRKTKIIGEESFDEVLSTLGHLVKFCLHYIDIRWSCLWGIVLIDVGSTLP